MYVFHDNSHKYVNKNSNISRAGDQLPLPRELYSLRLATLSALQTDVSRMVFAMDTELVPSDSIENSTFLYLLLFPYFNRLLVRR